MSHAFSLVSTRSDAPGLDERMYLAMLESTFLINGDFYYRSIAGDAGQVDIVWGAEVAKAICDEATFVDLDTANYVGTVAIDNIGTMVDTEVGQLAERTAILAQECLGTEGQSASAFALGATMERHDDQIAAAHQIINYATNSGKVEMLDGVAIVAECAESDGEPVALDDSALYATIDAGKQDALRLKYILGRLDTLQAKVVGVVVGHAHEVETGLAEQMTIAGGCAECV